MSISNSHWALLKCQTISVQMVRFDLVLNAELNLQISQNLDTIRKPVMEDSLNYVNGHIRVYMKTICYIFRFEKSACHLYNETIHIYQGVKLPKHCSTLGLRCNLKCNYLSQYV